MRVYLLRHAEPADQSQDTPLGPEGLQQAKRLGALFARLGMQREQTKIITSNALRARETAGLIGEALGVSCEDWECFPPAGDEGQTSDPVEGLLRLLAEIAADEGRDQLIVVGHLNYVPAAANRLMGFELKAPFFYGATVCVDCHHNLELGCGRLLWFVTPDLFPTVS